jgi:deoxyribodipyrimidine photolyase
MLQEVCQQNGVTHLFYNYQYELNERQRDRQLETFWARWFVKDLMTA